MREDNVYLQHILESITNISEYVGVLDESAFSKDKKTIAAVIRELEIIGEAANNLSDDFKKKHSEIPFRNMIDMRNFLTHEYFGVNAKVVWDTYKIDLPRLEEVIRNV